MSTRLTNVLLALLILAAFGAGAWAYPQLPERVASHWNAEGVADGSMPRFVGTFLLPLVMLLLALIYAVIPRIDPLRKNIEGFRKAYNAFWVFLMAFFVYMEALTIGWNLGSRFSMTLAILPAMSVLFFIIGMVMEKMKPNWFMGIRTPWTLSDARVWEKTHKLGGVLFKLVGVISLLALFAGPAPAIITLVVSALGAAIITIVYSYVAYRELKK